MKCKLKAHRQGTRQSITCVGKLTMGTCTWLTMKEVLFCCPIKPQTQARHSIYVGIQQKHKPGKTPHTFNTSRNIATSCFPVPALQAICMGYSLKLLPLYRCFRFIAYSSFVSWVWRYLGPGNRRQILGCAVRAIRGLYPSSSYQEYLD